MANPYSKKNKPGGFGGGWAPGNTGGGGGGGHGGGGHGGGGGGGHQGGGGGGGAANGYPQNSDPFHPAGPYYPTWGAFRHAIRRGVKGVIHPQLASVQQQMANEESATGGRQHDINHWYNYYQGQLQNAYGDVNDALNQLIVQNSGGDQQASAALAGALQGNADAAATQSQTIGADAAPSVANQAGAFTAAQGATGAGQNQLAEQAANILAQSQGRIGVAGLSRLSAHTDEQQRAQAAIEDLQRQEMGIKQSRPGVKQQVTEQLLQQERDAQAQRKQQQIAQKQLQQSATQEQHRHSEAVASLGFQYAQMHQQAQQAQQTLAEQAREANQANNPQAAHHAQAQAAAVQKADSWINSYMGGLKHSNDFNGQLVWRQLTNVFGLAPNYARMLLKASGRTANQWLKKHKGGGGNPNSGNTGAGPSASGGPGGGGRRPT